MESRSMFIRLNLKDIMAQAVDGSLVKVAYLRLYTKTGGNNLRICNKADTVSLPLLIFFVSLQPVSQTIGLKLICPIG